MAKVTALKFSRTDGKKVRVSLEGAPDFSLRAEIVALEKLKVGREISSRKIEGLKKRGLSERCYHAAAHFLSFRPRSENELKERLAKRGFDSSNIREVVSRLREQGLLDDRAFARFWVDNRTRLGPRSRWLIGRELKQKGVSSEVIDHAVDILDDGETAYNAAATRASRLTGSDYRSFRLRLGQYLKRRGFSYDVIKETTDRLWQELDKNNPPSADNQEHFTTTPDGK